LEEIFMLCIPAFSQPHIYPQQKAAAATEAAGAQGQFWQMYEILLSINKS